MNGEAVLGIDIGTTSIAAQTVSLETGDALHTYGFDHEAEVMLDGYPDAFAADADRLVETARAIAERALADYPEIAAIGLSGQMHGVVCCDGRLRTLSPLYTWQNAFGERVYDGKTLCESLRELTGESVPTGYGIVTLYALGRLGLLPEGTAQIATIADLAASRLCGLEAPVLHPTMASSLGLYDIEKGVFCPSAYRIAGDVRLPEIRDGYRVIGEFCCGGRSIPVAEACGDNQLGVFGSLAHDGMLLLSVGTSSQVSIVTDGAEPLPGCEVRPYFDGKRLLSGSGLCGGRAYAALAELVADVVAAFAPRPEKHCVYEYLNRLADEPDDAPLAVSTRFCGTREEPSLRGHISGISLENFDMRHLSAGVLRGIAEELHTMFLAMAQPGRRYAMAASGNTLRRCPALRRSCEEIFSGALDGDGLLLPRHTEEPAYGAALYASISAGLTTRERARGLIRYL